MTIIYYYNSLVYMKFKSKRQDGRGHRTPLSLTEPSKVFSIKLTESLANWLKSRPKQEIRQILTRYKRRNT